MPPGPPIPITAIHIDIDSPEYRAILEWPFAQQPFYEGQVKRLVENDIRHRVAYNHARIWIYKDPEGNAVGFGTFDLCAEYASLDSGKLHGYIPLLAVNPNFKKLGHGQSIVQHLVGECVVWTKLIPEISDLLFLDVYTANLPAISLYEKCGFIKLNASSPTLDPQENNEPYVIMVKRVATST